MAPSSSSGPASAPAGTKNVYLFSMDDRTIEVPFVLDGPVSPISPISPILGSFNPLSSAALCRGGCGVDCQAVDPLVRVPQLSATFSLQATLLGQPDLVGLALE